MTEKKNNTECKQSKVVSNFYEMKYPNEAIIVYNGKFSVSTGNSSIELDGTIYFGWYPQKGLRLEGINLKNDDQNLRKNFIISFSPIQTLLIDNQVVGHCITESCNDIDYKFKGRFINTAIKGDKTIPVEKITFALLNLKSLNGEQQEGDENTHKERITLVSKDFEINIYKVPNFKSASDELKQKGGYQILYNGEIRGSAFHRRWIGLRYRSRSHAEAASRIPEPSRCRAQHNSVTRSPR